MQRLKISRRCLVAAFVICAVAPGTAWATHSLPEVGRCVKVPVGTGTYSTANCVAVATGELGKKFEWTPASAVEKLAFSGTGLETTLTTAGHPTIKCLAANSSGEWTGPKTATVTTEFQGCTTTSGVQCQSLDPRNKSEIKTFPDEGEIGFLRHEEIEGKLIVVVGMDLKPMPPFTALAQYECTGSNETGHIEGSVVGKMRPINKMSTESVLVIMTKTGGAQQWEQFEGGPKDTLTTKFTLGTETFGPFETTLNIKSETGKAAAPLEIKAREK
jgi:hypothetical protein